MMRVFLIGAMAAVTLSACAPAVPNSASGVGFGDYDEYEARQRARDAELEGRTTVQPPSTVQSGPLDDDIAARARAVIENTGQGPVDASPSNPPPTVVTNAAGISGENDFEAVSGQRDIEDDAALIARNRAQYQVIAPTALPTRPGTNTPNIVEYALRTTNPVGAPLYRRSTLNAEAKFQRACARYPSSDLAQEAFLAAGGPERDREGMDPDGDGFACDWSPAPFRAVRGS